MAAPGRAIVGYARDEEGHWLAVLACGHGQHLRHTPPWQNRPWVLGEAGRGERLGHELPCQKCADSLPPVFPALI